MPRIACLFLLCVAVGGWTGCGEDCNHLYGSACSSRDCSFDTVRCTRYEPPNQAIKISYERTKTGREYAAMIMCELYEIDQVEGLRLDGQDFLNRCAIDSPGESWPDLKGIFCEFRKGGDRAGKELRGKCGLDFVTGTKATAEFCCPLKSAEL